MANDVFGNDAVCGLCQAGLPHEHESETENNRMAVFD